MKTVGLDTLDGQAPTKRTRGDAMRSRPAFGAGRKPGWTGPRRGPRDAPGGDGLAGRDAGPEGRAQAEPGGGSGGLLLVVLVLGPFFWRVADDLIGGEQSAILATEFSLWVCILCPALLAAALVAGWMRAEVLNSSN